MFGITQEWKRKRAISSPLSNVASAPDTEGTLPKAEVITKHMAVFINHQAAAKCDAGTWMSLQELHKRSIISGSQSSSHCAKRMYFTRRFVDPLIHDRDQSGILLMKNHSHLRLLLVGPQDRDVFLRRAIIDDQNLKILVSLLPQAVPSASQETRHGCSSAPPHSPTLTFRTVSLEQAFRCQFLQAILIPANVNTVPPLPVTNQPSLASRPMAQIQGLP